MLGTETIIGDGGGGCIGDGGTSCIEGFGGQRTGDGGSSI